MNIMEWKYINTKEDILNVQNIYEDFLDSEIINFRFETGNYIDKELVAYENNNNNLYITFQRMDINPFSIEICFEQVCRINFFSPIDYSSDILYASFSKKDDFIYWTDWQDFDINNEEHLNSNDFTLIEAKKAKWRIISLTPESNENNKFNYS